MPLTLAQRSNFAVVTALGYPLWRAHSLTLLGGQPFMQHWQPRWEPQWWPPTSSLPC